MLNVIFVIALLFLIIHVRKESLSQSVLIYIIGTFIAPVLRICSSELSFDIIAFPILLLLYLSKGCTFKLSLFKESLVPYLICYILITLINALRFDASISIATLYAIIRFIFTLYIIKNTWKNRYAVFVDKVLQVVMPLNLICCVLQLANLVPVSVFYNFYYKASMTPLMACMQAGYFERGYGTFGSPVILGGISALSYGFYLSTNVLKQYNVKWNGVKVFVSALCGLMALSKTAIISIPITTVFVLIMCFLFYGKNSAFSLAKTLGIMFAGVIVAGFVVLWLDSRGFFIKYYLGFLSNPLQALASRYGSSSGNLSNTIGVISAHPIFGVGHAQFQDVFTGDSTYIVLLYQTGIIGLISYFLPYISAFGTALMRKKLLPCAVMLAFLMIGVGNPLQLSFYFIPFAAIILYERGNSAAR